MSVVVMKLVTGEDIVANVDINEDASYLMKKPARIVLTPDGAAMIAIPPFSKAKELTVAREHVIYMGEPDEDMLNAYNSKFGSGLVVAQGLNLVT